MQPGFIKGKLDLQQMQAIWAFEHILNRATFSTSVNFRLFRHDKQWVPTYLTRTPTTLAYAYNLVAWLRMSILLLLLSQWVHGAPRQAAPRANNVSCVVHLSMTAVRSLHWSRHVIRSASRSCLLFIFTYVYIYIYCQQDMFCGQVRCTLSLSDCLIVWLSDALHMNQLVATDCCKLQKTA